MADASFDVVSEIDMQEVKNAMQIALKEITHRYDLKDAGAEIILNEKESKVDLKASDEYKIKVVLEIFEQKLVKRGISIKALVPGDIDAGLSGIAKQEVKLQCGIDREKSKIITKDIKGIKLKVQPQIQNDIIRVTGKKRDDLQAVMQFLREQNYDIPLQFVNFR